MFYGRGTASLKGFLLSRKPSTWLNLILFAAVAVIPVWSQQPTAQPEYQGGRGSSLRPGVKVAFKPGPFGPDGKVHQVVPDAKARRFPNETETPQEREAEMRAAAGAAVPSGKP